MSIRITRSNKRQLDLKATGFPGIDETTPITADDITIDTTARTLSITKAFNFFTDGSGTLKKYVKTGTTTFPAWPDTSGYYYLYFDSTGTAITTTTTWTNFSSLAPIATIYWNAGLSGSAKVISYGFECHQNTIPWSDHEWKNAYGAIWLSGLTLSATPITSGAPNVSGINTCVGLSSGSIMDDNLIYTITNSAVAGSFKQDMGELTAANITVSNGGKFAIPTESGGVGINITATRFPFAYSASNIIETVADNGTRTEVPSSDFAVYFLFSFQDPRNGETVRALSAVTSYGTITEARAVTWQTILATVSGLSGGQVRPLYRLIYGSRSTYDVAVKKAVLREYADIRQSAILTASSAAGSLPATSVTVTPAGNISSTNAQSALEELDLEKVPTTRSLTINGTAYDLSADRTWTISAGASFWTTMPGTPTRTGNTTFTITGDYSSLIAKGMVIKWTESSTVRVAMVSIPSTYGAPNTTITIIGDTMASIDASSLKYALIGAEQFIARFAYAGNIGATGTDVANAYYATEPMRVLGADLQVGTAGTTNSTTIDINKDGTTMFTTKPTLASTVATSPTPFTSDTATSLALADKVTIDIDAVQTTNAQDLYSQLYLWPSRLNNLT